MKHRFLALASTALLLSLTPVSGQLFDNLRSLAGTRYSVGDPALSPTNSTGDEVEGPKDIAVADLDGDGKPDFAASNKDGSVTVRYGIGDGTFGPSQHLHTYVTAPSDARTVYFTDFYTNISCRSVLTNVLATNFAVNPPVLWTNMQWVCAESFTNIVTNTWSITGPEGLRGLALADFTGDGKIDIAVASPGEAVIYLFVNGGGRNFGAPITLPMWLGVRDLAAGDFDGDGKMDLAAAGTTNGVTQLRGLGGGAFEVVTNITNLGTTSLWHDFPQPAFYLKAYRVPGDTRDELAVGHAQAEQVWNLRAGDDGRLAVQGWINARITALDVAPLLRPISDGIPDLLTGFSRDGCLIIYPAGSNGIRFMAPAAVSFFVPGGPRNVRAVDLDGDGWNDLVVVSQIQDKVITYRNDHGQFTLAAESLAGRSPREMDIGDFNSDGRPDLAVLNRFSFDVSIMLTSTNLGSPAGFLTLDSIYPVDGAVSGLQVRDYNGDGRDDVIQLHLATAEMSVRLSKTNGMLNPPDIYPFGGRPTAESVIDVNNDGIPDMVAVDLTGSISVRLGLGGGLFGPEVRYFLPSNLRGGLYSIVAADFNNDGYVDLAAGYFDCRLVFLKGNGDGTFSVVGDYDHPLYFGYEARSMVAGDFDHDGDLDLAGAGMDGRLTILENKGNLLTTNRLNLRTYPAPPGMSDIRTIQMLDANKDGDWDLFLAGTGGTALYLGGPGVTFTLDETSLPPHIGGASSAQADFDGDGIVDLAVANAADKTVTILTRSSPDEQYAPVLVVRVPSATFIATGDLDGDGKPDLVGTGDVLWVALSSRHTTNAPPAEQLAGRGIHGVVINEILSKNASLPLAIDGGRLSDWVEIYNGNSQLTSLANWQLKLVRTNITTFTFTNFFAGSNQLVVSNLIAIVTNLFTFPADASLGSRAYRILICDDHLRSPYHTGFKLPAEGGFLALLNDLGVEVDHVTFPAIGDDLSFARYSDGSRTFVMNNIPTPGAPNIDNGAVDPVVTFNGVDFDVSNEPVLPLRFRAAAKDDLAVVNVSVLWRWLGIPDENTKRLILYDDGMSDDAGLNDGIYAGQLTDDIPPGSEIQFYLECTDFSDQIVTAGGSTFVSPGKAPKVYTLAVGVPKPPLEISEILPYNSGGLTDERGGSPDWVEIRNCSSNALSLAGVGLSEKFFGDSSRMVFTNYPSLSPGEHLVVYCDGKPSQGPLHAPFKLNRLGGQILLTGTTANGGRFLIDSLTYGPATRNIALARLGCAGPWISNAPTPRAANVAGPWQSLIDSGAFVLAFPTRPGDTYTVESKDSLNQPAWTTRQRTRGDGLEQTIRDTMGAKRFFRVRDE